MKGLFLMNKQYKYFFIIFTLLFIAADGLRAFDCNIQTNKSSGYDIEFSVTEDIEFIVSDDGVSVKMTDQVGPMEAGMPDLPLFVEILNGKSDESLSVVVVTAEYEVVTQNVTVVAIPLRETTALGPQDSETKNLRRPRDDIYNMNSFWPESHIQITEAWHGNRKFLRIAIWPVQYNPVTGTVRVCKSFKAKLNVIPSRDEEGPRGPLRRGRSNKISTAEQK